MAETYPLRFGKYVLLKPMARGGMGAIFLAAAGERGFQKFCVVQEGDRREERPREGRTGFSTRPRVEFAPLATPTWCRRSTPARSTASSSSRWSWSRGRTCARSGTRCVRTRTRNSARRRAARGARDRPRARLRPLARRPEAGPPRRRAPPNILISYFGEVKLTDFGLARSVLKQENTAPGVVFGRASYLSPEQARGEIADARTDIYSLGIVLWELVTGNQYLQLANLDPATAMSLVAPPARAAAVVEGPPGSRPTSTRSSCGRWRRIASSGFNRPRRCARRSPTSSRRFSPRADAERTADFLRGLYDAVAKEERTERRQAVGRERARCWRRPRPLAHPTGCRCRSPCWNRGSTRLQFPKEEESAGGRLHRAGDRQPLPGSSARSARGGMGTVYAGEHVEIGKDVAIKILHPAYSTQQDLVERFRARGARRLAHWPPAHHRRDRLRLDRGRLRLLRHGAPRRDRSRRRAVARAAPRPPSAPARSPSRSAARWPPRTRPASSTATSSRRTSSWWRATGRPTSSRCSTSASRAAWGGRGGSPTPAWRWGRPSTWPPSRPRGGAVDQRSDIFSVGALIYEMVSGSPPQMSRDKELIPPRGIKADVPEELDRIAVRALDPIPARRYQSMAQFEYDLAKSLYGRPRAVAELLGLHDQERGVVPASERSYSDEAPGAGTHPRADSPPPISYATSTPSSSSSSLLGRGARHREPAASGAIALRARRGERVGGTRGRSRRWALVAVAAVPIYRRLPWGAQTATPSRTSGAPRCRVRPIVGRSACGPGWRTWSGCWGADSASRSSPPCRTGWRACAPTAATAITDTLATPGARPPGEGGRGGARSRSDRGWRRALSDRAGARRARRR